MSLRIEPAALADVQTIRALLLAAALPVDDLDSASIRFWVARGDTPVVGAVALERYGAAALLRSLVVERSHRNQGVGAALVAALECEARASGVTLLVLLTQTAREFFAHRGYAVSDRALVPPALQQSAEFRSLCPASALCMAKPLTPNRTATPTCDRTVIVPDPATHAGTKPAQPSADPIVPVTIYHNPQCGTSRNALALIRNAGVEPAVIEYLKTPPDRETLRALIARMGLTPRQLLREKGPLFAELGLAASHWTEEQLIDQMLVHPILINRPIVVTPWGAKLCRPSEAVLDILPLPQKGPFAKEDGEPVIDSTGRRV